MLAALEWEGLGNVGSFYTSQAQNYPSRPQFLLLEAISFHLVVIKLENKLQFLLNSASKTAFNPGEVGWTSETEIVYQILRYPACECQINWVKLRLPVGHQ